MTDEQITMVQTTFLKVLSISDAAATLFYQRLFELDPTTKPLFARADMERQKHVLMSTLKTVVLGLRNFDSVRVAVESLGRRHVYYKVEERHYATVGQALLWALEQGLGADFTPEVKEAWTKAYLFLAGVMKEAASKEAAEIVTR